MHEENTVIISKLTTHADGFVLILVYDFKHFVKKIFTYLFIFSITFISFLMLKSCFSFYSHSLKIKSIYFFLYF